MFIGAVAAVVLGLLGLILAANDQDGWAILCIYVAGALFSLQCIVWFIAIIKIIWVAI
jgi:hypothetical protein